MFNVQHEHGWITVFVKNNIHVMLKSAYLFIRSEEN